MMNNDKEDRENMVNNDKEDREIMAINEGQVVHGGCDEHGGQAIMVDMGKQKTSRGQNENWRYSKDE